MGDSRAVSNDKTNPGVGVLVNTQRASKGVPPYYIVYMGNRYYGETPEAAVKSLSKSRTASLQKGLTVAGTIGKSGPNSSRGSTYSSKVNNIRGRGLLNNATRRAQERYDALITSLKYEKAAAIKVMKSADRDSVNVFEKAVASVNTLLINQIKDTKGIINNTLQVIHTIDNEISRNDGLKWRSINTSLNGLTAIRNRTLLTIKGKDSKSRAKGILMLHNDPMMRQFMAYSGAPPRARGTRRGAATAASPAPAASTASPATRPQSARALRRASRRASAAPAAPASARPAAPPAAPAAAAPADDNAFYYAGGGGYRKVKSRKARSSNKSKGTRRH